MHDVSSHVLDWKLTAKPLTHLRLPYGAAIPVTTHHEPWTFSFQIPTSNYVVPEELHAFFYSPSPAISLYQPAPRHPPKLFTCGRRSKVQKEVQIMSQPVGHGLCMSSSCKLLVHSSSFLKLFIEHIHVLSTLWIWSSKKALLHKIKIWPPSIVKLNN